MCWSVKQTKITVLLLLFCSVLCTHAQVCNRCVEMPDSGFISYRLEGEPAHRLFLQEDTLRVKVKGMGRKSGKNWEKNSIFGNEKKSIFENGCCGSSPMNFCLQ